MDESHLLRAARRYAGLSQRALAARAGVSASTVAALEAGQRAGSVPTVARLLHAAGLELAAVPGTPTPCKHLRQYLKWGLVERLYRAVGGRQHPTRDRSLEAWRGLWQLTGQGRVEVVGAAAVGVWAPVVAARPTVRVEAYTPPLWRPGRAKVPGLAVVPSAGTVARVLVPIGFCSRQVWVAAPDVLALDPAYADHSLVLRAAAVLLHEELPVDDAHRRAPAHRDPQPRRDDHVVRHTKAFARLPLPEPADRRGWQLDGQASLAQWLRRRGYPT